LKFTEKFVGVPGGDALHSPAATIAGKLLFGQCAGKAYPDRPVAPGKAFQHGRGKGQIACALGQGKHLSQRLPAAGRACGGIALSEGCFCFGKGYGQSRRDTEQMHAVLAGVEVGQHKTGLFAGDAQQRGELVGDLRQLDGDAALAAGGLPELAAQLAAAQQHGSAHQRHQHQKRRKQRRPERIPAFVFVHKYPRLSGKVWAE